MILLLDNYDSFTYNVYQQLSELGAQVEVVRNDKITPDEIRNRNYDAIVISPGPGVPKDAGITEQLIGEVFGGKVVRNKEIVHGKTSPLHHNGKGIYQGLPQNVEIGRYHSLIIERESLPNCLEITSELEDGTIMGVRHKEYDIEGIQFHPESILTAEGHKMMRNFVNLVSH